MIEVERGGGGHRALVGVTLLVPLLVVALVPMLASQPQLHRFSTALTYGVVLVALSYMVGHVGLLSLAHGAFMGIGALAATHVIRAWGLPLLAAPFASVVLGAVVGLAVGAVALRVARLHLALLTLAVAVSFPILLRKYGGPLGIVVPGDVVPPAWTGIDPLDEETWQYLVVLAGACAALFVVVNLTRGRFGREVTAMRQDPVAASAFGIDVRRTGMVAFAASSAVAAWGGGLSVLDTPFVSWSQYPFMLGVELFALVMIMGRGRLVAAFAGGFVYVFGPVWLSDRGYVGDETLIYAVFLIAVILVFRGRGLGHAFEWLTRRVVRIVDPADPADGDDAAGDDDAGPLGPVADLVLLDPDDRRGTWPSAVRD